MANGKSNVNVKIDTGDKPTPKALTKRRVFGKKFVLVNGGCSSGVEFQIVDLAVAGSKPVIHPYYTPPYIADLCSNERFSCACSSPG